MSICNRCNQRRCRVESVVDEKTGRDSCPNHVPIKGTWSFLEIALGNDMLGLYTTLYNADLQVVKTKAGFRTRVKPNV